MSHPAGQCRNRPAFVLTLFMILAAVLCAAVGGLGCRPAPTRPPPPAPVRIDPARFSGDRAFAEVKDLVALGLRDSNTPGSARAAEHLRQCLEARSIAARVDEFAAAMPGGTGVFRNVIGRVPGTQSGLIVLGAHYDTKSGMPEGFQGANDSGSGVGVLLELARLLQESAWQGPEIRLAFLDGEECVRDYGEHDGLHGSRRLARQLAAAPGPAGIRGVIIVDMVGDADLNVSLPRNGTPDLETRVFAAAQAEGVRSSFALFPGDVLDDHVPFLTAGIPAVDLIDFQYGSAPGLNDYWHAAGDRLEHVSPASLATVGRVVLRTLPGLAAR